MNGYPVVFFAGGRFDRLVLCATSDIATAWAAGANCAARATGIHLGHAVCLGRLYGLNKLALAAVTLDEQLYEDAIDIAPDQRKKALEALERSFSHSFPPLITIVK